MTNSLPSSTSSKRLDLSGKEEVHSRFLVWLLDPHQNHGAGDYFLRHFLLATGAATPDEVHDIDWSTTSVRREWLAVVDGEQGYLDILLVNHRAQILCAIENKIFSPEGFSEGISQLTHYRRALENDFCDFSRRHVFLSPQGVPRSSNRSGNSGRRRITPPSANWWNRRKHTAAMPSGKTCAYSCGNTPPR